MGLAYPRHEFSFGEYLALERNSEVKHEYFDGEIFAMAADYSPSLPETTQFFQFIQNKLHFAATGASPQGGQDRPAESSFLHGNAPNSGAIDRNVPCTRPLRRQFGHALACIHS